MVEASSGNTGIGLAVACAAKGYPFVCVMAESFSIERRKLMRKPFTPNPEPLTASPQPSTLEPTPGFLGAKVILTNPAHKGSGMVIKPSA